MTTGLLASILDRLIPKVESVMKSPVRMIDEEATVSDAMKTMMSLRMGSLIVTRYGKPIGIFTRYDLMHRVLDPGRDVNAVKVVDVASSPLISINAKQDLQSAVRLMNSNGITRLSVLRGGTTVGILTMTDLMLKFPRGYFSRGMLLKRFLVDTLAYITFWSWIWTLIQIYILKFTLIQYLENTVVSTVITVIFGGLYGRYLDVWRRKMSV